MEKIVKGYHIFLNQVLGEGANATVYLAKKSKTEEKYAVKTLNKDKVDGDEYSKRAVKAEIQLMKAVDSPNIVKLYGVFESSRNYYIVQQLCETSLEKVIKQQKKLPQEKMIKIFDDISIGMLTLIRNGIVHRDLKPANILYSDGNYKIGDFGIATRNSHSNVRNSSIVGTPLYMSPQILKGETYTSKCDIWSLGVIFYELLHGKTPWQATTEHELVQQITKIPIKFDSSISPVMQNFILGCLKPSEEERFSWQKFFDHEIHGNKFVGYVKEKKFYEWKFNKIMNDIRFMINQRNININRMFKIMGIQFDHDLTKEEFGSLMEKIVEKQRPEDMNFFFTRMDINGDGKVSRSEFEKMLKLHNIPINSSSVLPMRMKIRKDEVFEELLGLSEEISQKVQSCFEKMFAVLKKKDTTLEKFFKKFKSKLNKEDLFKILKSLDGNFNIEESDELFAVIDVDCSGEIDLFEFKSYYERVLGIAADM